MTTRRPSFASLPTLDRRRLLQLAGGGAAGLAFSLALPTPARANGPASLPYPFTNGVASGDPVEDGVVLWTRVAPDPLAPNGGLNPDARIAVDWQVAQDEGFHAVVAAGTVITSPDTSHTVHIDVRGLKAGHHYFYRFRAGGQISEVGRTWTAPPIHAMRPLKFAVASCQNWRAGYFQTMADAVDQGAELMMFVGDYLYEYAVQQLPVGRHIDPALPSEIIPVTVTLDQYRLRYSLYKTDPDLVLAHQTMPWIMTWDDHEVANDYESWATPDPGRRAAGYRAYWEFMPIRWPKAPVGTDARLYRRFRFGQLAQVDVLDTREYRAPQVSGTVRDDGPRRDPDRRMLGAEQEAWFTSGLGTQPARWNIVAQQILMTRMNTASDPEAPAVFSAGTWDGYQATQQRVYDAVAAAEARGTVRNFVVMSGDVHCSYISDMPANTLDPDPATVIGAEFTSTSISSALDFDPAANEARQVRRRVNPTLKWADLHCGYVLADLTADRMAVDIRVVDKVSVHNDPVFTGASFVVEDRVPGVTPL